MSNFNNAYLLDTNKILGKKFHQSKTIRQETSIYKQLLDRVPVIMIILQDNKICYVNAAFESILGFKREKIIHMNWKKLIHSDYRVLVSSTHKDVQEDRELCYRYETKILNKDAETVWMDLSYSIIKISGQDFVIISAYDITQSNLTREELQLSEARYRAIIEDQAELKKAKEELEQRVEQRTADLSKANQELLVLNNNLTNIVKNMSDGVFMVDKSGEIQILNGVLEGLWGDLAGEIQDWIKKDILYSHKSSLYRMLQEGKSFRDEEIILAGKKGDLHCLASGTPIKDEQGEMNSGVIMVRPIKEIRKLVNRFTGAQANFYFSDIVSKDPQFHKIINLAMIATANLSNVLIEGESGTGKEMFAQAIHNESSHRNGPFIAVNCGAIPRELVGSELFGYADGAFTGAKKGGSPGKFELASGGTIFLDEIGDMPIDQQVALLRVIQEKKITRIGGQQVIPVDVRIICASNKNLAEQISKGNFRQDLYYRLNVISLKIPPLRERKDDIPLLFRYFISKYTGKDINSISPEILSSLIQYKWPGNVRELQNVVERMIYMANGGELLPEHLPLEISNYQPNKEGSQAEYLSIKNTSEKESTRKLVAQIERDKIVRFLNLHDGNISRVAQEMGFSRRTIYRKIKLYGIKH